jgi:hypothetical protein
MQPHRLPRNLFAGLATITHSPRGLLCVRKSRAIRNEHEGPPRRSLFALSSECCSIELVVSRARFRRDREQRCLGKTKKSVSTGDPTLRLNITFAAIFWEMGETLVWKPRCNLQKSVAVELWHSNENGK